MKSKQPSKKEKHEYEPLPCDKQVSYFLCLLEDGPVRINFTRGKLHWESFIYLLSVCWALVGFSI